MQVEVDAVLQPNLVVGLSTVKLLVRANPEQNEVWIRGNKAV